MLLSGLFPRHFLRSIRFLTITAKSKTFTSLKARLFQTFTELIVTQHFILWDTELLWQTGLSTSKFHRSRTSELHLGSVYSGSNMHCFIPCISICAGDGYQARRLNTQSQTIKEMLLLLPGESDSWSLFQHKKSFMSKKWFMFNV